MSSDGGSPIPPRKPALPDLPQIRSIRIRRVPFHPPRLAHFTSTQRERADAVEFLVKTDGDVPARAYGPALFVGDVEVDQSERVDARTWRFWALAPERLQQGAPIGWGWMKDPSRDRQRTAYRFAIEGEGPKGG